MPAARVIAMLVLTSARSTGAPGSIQQSAGATYSPASPGRTHEKSRKHLSVLALDAQPTVVRPGSGDLTP